MSVGMVGLPSALCLSPVLRPREWCERFLIRERGKLMTCGKRLGLLGRIDSEENQKRGHIDQKSGQRAASHYTIHTVAHRDQIRDEVEDIFGHFARDIAARKHVDSETGAPKQLH